MPKTEVEYNTRYYAAFKRDPHSEGYSHVEEVSDRDATMAVHVADPWDTCFVIYDVTRFTLDGMELTSEPYRFTDVHFIDGQAFTRDQLQAMLSASLVFDDHHDKTEDAIFAMDADDNLDVAVLVFEVAEVRVDANPFNKPHWVTCNSNDVRIVPRSTPVASE